MLCLEMSIFITYGIIFIHQVKITDTLNHLDSAISAEIGDKIDCECVHVLVRTIVEADSQYVADFAAPACRVNIYFV